MEIQLLCEMLSKYSQDYANETLIGVKVLLKDILVCIYKQINIALNDLIEDN